jgi:hypothetical protein
LGVQQPQGIDIADPKPNRTSTGWSIRAAAKASTLPNGPVAELADAAALKAAAPFGACGFESHRAHVVCLSLAS